MMTIDPSVSPGDPHRIPDWRWRLVTAIAEGESVPILADSPDTDVGDAVAALGGLGRTSDADLDERTNDILSARQMWIDDAWDRVLLEARLLTGVTVTETAHQLQIGEPLVDAFCRLFFDVRSRLRHTGFINRFAIRAPKHFEEAPDLRTAIRAFAYFGGPYVLDAVVATYADSITPCGINDRAMTLWLDPALRKSVRAAVQTFMTPVTADNAEAWLQLYVDQRAAEALGRRRRTQRSIVAAIRRRHRHGAVAPTPKTDDIGSTTFEEEETKSCCSSTNVPPLKTLALSVESGDVECAQNDDAQGVFVTHSTPEWHCPTTIEQMSLTVGAVVRSHVAE